MKFRLKNTVLIGFAFMSIMALWQVYNWLVPLYLDGFLHEKFSGNEFLIGLIMGLDNLIAIVMIPLVGKWSDKEKAKTGQRKKLISAGIILAAAAFIMLSYTRTKTALLLIGNLMLVLFAMNLYRSPAVALMPDITPEPLRSKANAVINIMGGVGTGIGYLLLLSAGILDLDTSYALFGVALIMTMCLGVILFGVDEKRFAAEMRQDLADYILENPQTALQPAEKVQKIQPMTKGDKRNLVFVLVAVFFYYMAINSVETFMSLYSLEVYGNTNSGLMLFGVFSVGAFCFLYPAALYAEHRGRKKAIMTGLAILLIAEITISCFAKFSYVLVLPFFAAGGGTAFVVANIYPLVVSFCKDGGYGRYTGYYYAITMIAQVVTPAVAGLLFSDWLFGSMKGLMPYSSLFITLALVAILSIKKSGEKPLISKHAGSVVQKQRL